MRCLIWCLNETWKPTRWRSCQSYLRRSRDRSRDKASRQRNPETWWRRTTATLLGVSFGSYRRRRGDVLMRRRGYVPLRRLGDVPLRRCWVFHLRRHWDVLMGRHYYVPLRRRHDISIRREDELLRRLGGVPLRHRSMFHLRRTCDVAGTYRETSLRRPRKVLLPGGVVPMLCNIVSMSFQRRVLTLYQKCWLGGWFI